ncbi:hypothetical protein LCGC14_0018200 [marine sediment metagenome]|uniref:Uncharacterized protein n=1 Tax=marine sediment metagenome TaxID=412755 RepID=A0A0F9Z2L1_9ZZZZ|nr:radical SAM protein [Phycisphaerae bacterium]
MLDLLLVRPGGKKRLYGSLSETLAAVEPPMWVGLMAGIAREKGFSVSVLDADVEGLTAREVADRVTEAAPALLGVVVSGSNPSASTMSMAEAGDILRAVKELSPETPAFLSGLHPSALPEHTLRHELADFVVQGETFLTLIPLLEAAKSRSLDGPLEIPGLWVRRGEQILSNDRPPLVADLDSLPMIAWDLLPMDHYRAHNWHCFAHPDRRQPYAVIYTSLGCPFRCDFCCINAIFGAPGIRYRSPEKVLEEIDLLHDTYGVTNLKIMDEMFVLKPSHVLAICDGLIERNYGLNIWAYARIDTVNEALLNRLKAAGVNWLAYGIEAGNNAVRQGVAKGGFDGRQILKAIAMTKEAGIHVGGNFIFGLPEDTADTMQETLDLAIELNCEYANFYAAMAFPGSELYDQAIAEGWPLPTSWAGYSQYGRDTFPLPTKYLTSSEVLRFRDHAFREYYSRPEYLQMLRETFGPPAVEHVQTMLERKLDRKYA